MAYRRWDQAHHRLGMLYNRLTLVDGSKSFGYTDPEADAEAEKIRQEMIEVQREIEYLEDNPVKGDEVVQ